MDSLRSEIPSLTGARLNQFELAVSRNYQGMFKASLAKSDP